MRLGLHRWREKTPLVCDVPLDRPDALPGLNSAEAADVIEAGYAQRGLLEASIELLQGAAGLGGQLLLRRRSAELQPQLVFQAVDLVSETGRYGGIVHQEGEKERSNHE